MMKKLLLLSLSSVCFAVAAVPQYSMPMQQGWAMPQTAQPMQRNQQLPQAQQGQVMPQQEQQYNQSMQNNANQQQGLYNQQPSRAVPITQAY